MRKICFYPFNRILPYFSETVNKIIAKHSTNIAKILGYIAQRIRTAKGAKDLIRDGKIKIKKTL